MMVKLLLKQKTLCKLGVRLVAMEISQVTWMCVEPEMSKRDRPHVTENILEAATVGSNIFRLSPVKSDRSVRLGADQTVWAYRIGSQGRGV